MHDRDISTDRLTIQGLRVQAIIGVRDWEQKVRQPLVIDLEMTTDAARAAAHDQLEDALDYGTVARRITAAVEASRHALIETLAEELATLIRSEFGSSWVRVRVGKPGAVPNAELVVIDIERGDRPPA